MADGSVLEVDGFDVYRVVGDSVGFVAEELTLVPRHLLIARRRKYNSLRKFHILLNSGSGF